MAPKIGTVLAPRTPDLTGQRFGRLTVLERRHHVDNRGRSRWLWVCVCDCGNSTTTYPYDLMRPEGKRHKISCGCYKPSTKSVGEASFSRLFGRYSRDAARRKLEFSLSKEQFKKLTQDNCHYCDEPPTRKHGSRRSNGYYVYNGIDRVDNSVGYITSNVVSCCFRCNKGKSTLKYEEWINLCKRVALKHS